MGHHMCSHTPQECPLGISIGISIEIYTIWHHLEGLQIGLRYLQIAQIWLFWTYPWNPRYHGNRPIWPFWTSEIPPVSSYSRLYIHIWTYSGTPLAPSVATCGIPRVHGTPYVLPYTPRMPFGHIHGTSHRDAHHMTPSGGSPDRSQIPPNSPNMAILDISMESQISWKSANLAILDIWNTTRE